MTNLPLCTAAGGQQQATIVSDGAGGAIVSWVDHRSGTSYDIYAQRVSADGAVQWTSNGVALCTAADDQQNPTVASDGAGGAIVAWVDRRGGSEDIYAQRISNIGEVKWATDGVALCTAVGDQHQPAIVSDGAGGAIVTWADGRSGSGYDIYSARLSAAGEIQWIVDILPLHSAPYYQAGPAVVSDGASGAIVTWADDRAGYQYDIYAQRITAAGAANWVENGVPLCTAQGHQLEPSIVADGVGGAIVTWRDGRDYRGEDLHAQRISAAGGIMWNADGVALCPANNIFLGHRAASDGAGGAVVSWFDINVYNPGRYTVRAERVSANGVPRWGSQYVTDRAIGTPVLTADGAGGAIVAWEDTRDYGCTHVDVYAQRISAAGGFEWNRSGVPICMATGDQQSLAIVSDGALGAIVGWQDGRSSDGTPSGLDIYAQRVPANGQLGDPGSGLDCSKARASVERLWPPNHEMVPVDIIGITSGPPHCPSWNVTIDGVTQDEPLGTAAEGAACQDARILYGRVELRAERDGSGNGRVYAIAFTVRSEGGICRDTVRVCVPHDLGAGSACQDDGQQYNSMAACRPSGASLTARDDEVEGVPDHLGLTVASLGGNRVFFEYTLPADADVRLEIYDVAGRRVDSLERGRRGAGLHSVAWNAAGIRSGVYFCHLQTAIGRVSRAVPIMK